LESLIEKIRLKKAKIAFIGLGKMGLPSALLFAEAGFEVAGVDVNQDLVKQLNTGINPYFEPGLEKLLPNKNFTPHTNYAAIKNCDVVLCAVPTLLKDKKPDYSIVETAFAEIGKHLKKGSLVVFESNVAPGVTESLVKNSIEKNGFTHGTDYFLAYVPIQGKAGVMLADLKRYERVAAGLNEEARSLAALLFESIGNKVLLASSIRAVELEKLFANIYKDMSIAISNELSYYCEKKDVDVKEVIRFANLIPGIHLLEPGIGVGGNCLPVDPYFYIDDAKKEGLSAGMAERARKVNDSKPFFIAEKIISLAKKRKAKKIVLLGMAFRPNTHETAYSPAIEVYKHVSKEFPEVTFAYDPVVGEERLKKLGIASAEISKGDLAVLLVEHSVFKGENCVRAEDL